ncbi:MAG TPA: carboxypeptidase-like regulatory domain-containing protein, partial [Candidatus Acidoferrales bacterium]|nr:carboxypeptidase-like regulatory domain-containing protein [Candidatus Acidoferrales bacterium]
MRVDAQVVGGTLSGTVTDQTGGAVPNAAVEIRDNATGETHAVTTTSDGVYTAPNLTPGIYTVTLTSPGFQKTVQSNITMTVGGAQTLNMIMRVGQETETIEVSTEAPTVNLTNAEIGGITTEAAIK